MTKDAKINLTDEQVDCLIDSLLPSGPDPDELVDEGDADEDATGDALSDEDTVSYALDMLHGQNLERVERVIASSPEARERMAWLRREAEAWKGPAGEERVRAIARSIRLGATPRATAIERLRQAAANFFGDFSKVLQANLRLSKAAGFTPEVGHGETGDGLVRWEILRGTEDSLVVRLASWATSLEGTIVCLRVGTWVAECVLKPISPQELGVEATLPAEVRRGAGEAQPAMSIEIIVEGPANAPREA